MAKKSWTKFTWLDGEMEKLIEMNAEDRLTVIMIKLVDQAKIAMKSTTTYSPTYRHKGPSDPSAPGFPPAVQTGRLWGSLGWAISTGKRQFGNQAIQIPKAKKPSVKAVFGSSVAYMYYQEVGVSPHLKKRPVLRPILDKNMSFIKKITGAKRITMMAGRRKVV